MENSLTSDIPAPATGGDGAGCHGGKAEMLKAAAAAGKSETLERYAQDYPQGPHDQPQSMCPAFGSLRVGLRMRRTATILSGSACCVYGLTFTSHFYGAKRTVNYVPFNSETLVTGKLYEDIRDAVFKMADPELYDAIVVTNLCVPTASGVPIQKLPKQINGVRIIPIDVPGFGVPTHAEAKDVLAGAMLSYARREAELGPVQAPRAGLSDKPTVAMVGEMFPVDPVMIGRMLEPMGLAAGPVVPPANGANSMPRWIAPSSLRSTLSTPPASANSRLPDGPSLAPPPLVTTARKPGSMALAAPAAYQDGWWTKPRTSNSPPSARRWPPTRSRAASRCRATRVQSCWSPACWSNRGRTCVMSVLPAPKPAGRMPTGNGWKRAA